MDRERTREVIKVMQHWADGGCVEGRRLGDNTIWGECFNPAWEWMEFEYRIASNEPDESDIGKMVEVSDEPDHPSSWISRRLLAILPEAYSDRFICNWTSFDKLNWRGYAQARRIREEA